MPSSPPPFGSLIQSLLEPREYPLEPWLEEYLYDRGLQTAKDRINEYLKGINKSLHVKDWLVTNRAGCEMVAAEVNVLARGLEAHYKLTRSKDFEQMTHEDWVRLVVEDVARMAMHQRIREINSKP